MSNSLPPHGLQHARLPCPSTTPRAYIRPGKQTLGGHKNLWHTRTQEKGAVTPTRDQPRLVWECPGVSSRGVGWWWPAAGLGALSVAVHAWGLLKEVAIIFITSTIVSVQFSHSVMSDSLQPRGLQHSRLSCPSPTFRIYSDSCPLSW